MSLRGFHILFIIASVISLAMYGLWSWQKFQTTEISAHLIAAIGSVALAVFLIFYEINFVKKTHEPT
jgi:hypothetical protein